MKRAIHWLALAGMALLPAPLAAQDETPARRGQLLMLRVVGDPDTLYAAYHAVPGDRRSLVVQRSTGPSLGADRVELSASSCAGLREAVEAVEQVPWPALSLAPGPGGPYLERGQFTAYTFYGALDYEHATSWETVLSILDVHGQPRGPFVRWAANLVQTVDDCIARRGLRLRSGAFSPPQ